MVAALTIPSVVAKYQKKQYYTQFMKTYNTLSNAFSMATNDYGPYPTWGLEGESSKEKLANILKEYIKTAEAPTSFDGVSGLKTLGSTTEMMGYSNMLSAFPNHFFLPDGSMIMVFAASQDWQGTELYIDTNGIKEPNMLGRDFFVLDYKTSDYKDTKYALTSPDKESKYCDPNIIDNEAGGMSCPYRLLTEGKMDY